MGIYIWLLFNNIAIHCIGGSGCLQVSMEHLNYLVGIGSIEVVFELAGIVKIYTKKINGKK